MERMKNHRFSSSPLFLLVTLCRYLCDEDYCASDVRVCVWGRCSAFVLLLSLLLSTKKMRAQTFLFPTNFSFVYQTFRTRCC